MRLSFGLGLLLALLSAHAEVPAAIPALLTSDPEAGPGARHCGAGLAGIRAQIQRAGAKEWSPLFQELLQDVKALAERSRAEQGLTEAEVACRRDKEGLLSDLLLRAPAELRRQASFHSLRGSYFLQVGDEEKARQAFQAAVDRNTTAIVANFELSRLLGDEADGAGEERHLKRALVETARSPEERLAQDEALARLAELVTPSELLPLAEERLEREPQNSALAAIIAEAALRSGDQARLEKISPKLSPVLQPYFKAEGLFLQKKYLEAAALFAGFAVDAKAPAHLEKTARARWAESLLKAEKFFEARQVAEESLAKHAGDARLSELQEEAIRAGALDPQDPWADLQKALARNPNSAGLQWKAVEILIDKARLQSGKAAALTLRQAEARLDHVSEDARESPEVFYWKAYIEFRRKNLDLADVYVTQATDALEEEVPNRQPATAAPGRRKAPIYALAVRIKRARGLESEAQELLKAARAALPSREEKEELEKETAKR